MNDLVTQLRDAWGALSGKQRMTLLLSAALSIGAVASIVWWARQPTYSILYTGLDIKDAQAVVQELQSRKIPFQLRDGGTGVEAPIEQVDKLRMELAVKNLPGSGRFGFMEMFSQDTIAQSDRTQKIRYQKALEDELAHTVESLESVRTARVHLVLPGDRVFLDDQDVAKASVTLGLNRSATPSADEVRAIVHIVSGAVQGLTPDRVSVVDTAGHTLWEGDGANGGLVTARQNEMKASVEKDINTKVARVLEPIVGADHFVVRTSADVDFQKVVRKERTLDPDTGALISEQKTKEKTSSSAGTGGVPGTASNLPGGQQPTTNGGGESSESSNTTNNYEYSVVERTVEEPVGSVKKLSVAVLVDQASKAAQGAPGAAPAARETTPRSAEDLKKIEQLVKAAISFDGNRGDIVTVEQAPFQQPVEAPAPGFDWKAQLPYLKYPLLVLLMLMAFLLFYRPFLRTARDAVARSKEPRRPAAVAAAASVEAAKILGPASQTEMLRQRLAKLAAEQPQGMAQTVRVWLHEPKES